MAHASTDDGRVTSRHGRVARSLVGPRHDARRHALTHLSNHTLGKEASSLRVVATNGCGGVGVRSPVGGRSPRPRYLLRDHPGPLPCPPVPPPCPLPPLPRAPPQLR